MCPMEHKSSMRHNANVDRGLSAITHDERNVSFVHLIEAKNENNAGQIARSRFNAERTIRTGATDRSPVPLKVIIETKNGEVYETDVVTKSMTTQAGMSELITDIYLRSYGDGFWHPTREQFETTVEQRHTSSEWKCDYCGSVNGRVHKHCESCGGRRSFLWG